MKYEEVKVYSNITEEEFLHTVYIKREPALLRNVNIGPCTKLWTCAYLSNQIGKVDVKVHVSSERKMDFINKNFVYKTLQFDELLSRASESKQNNWFLCPEEYYYLRSLGSDPRAKEVADIRKQFPNIANDITIPSYFKESDFFSSVFRIGSAGVQLWTHYDIMDNILLQIKGRKRMVLYSPSDALNMYLNGDKSEVLDIDNPDVDKYPKFVHAQRYECLLEPGDIIFIPALWFHNALALDFSIAVNVFWKHLSHDMYDKHDPYGNKDVIPASRALQMMGNAVKMLSQLPPEYKDFYIRRMISSLESQIT